MRLRWPRTAVLLAAPAGVLAGHGLGYLGGDPHAVDHAYLGGAVAVVGPLAVAALLWAAVVGSRSGRAPVRPLPVGPLLAAQWILFAGQEMTEHALAGHGPAEALRSPAVWLGVAAQAVVALALALLLRAAGVAGARLLTSISQSSVAPGAAAGGWPRRAARWSPAAPPGGGATSRGPPLLLA